MQIALVCKVCGKENLETKGDLLICRNCRSELSMNGKIIKDNDFNDWAIIKSILGTFSNSIFIILFISWHHIEASVYYIVAVFIGPFIADIKTFRLFKDYNYSEKRDFSVWVIKKALTGFYKQMDTGNKIFLWSIVSSYSICIILSIIGILF